MTTKSDDNREEPDVKLVYKRAFAITFGDFGQWHHYARFQRPIDDRLCGEIAVVWTKNTQMTFREFYDKFDERACPDWNKISPDGNPVAWVCNATRQANGKALYELPYPPETILIAVEHLCRYRSEGVIEVNDWLAWVKHDIAHPDQKSRHDFSQYPSMISVVEL